ncbi:MAG: hypothetical protein JOY71_01565, partial [Acetobacteraceae bacterium]|nr:hypothetical protein [Acetobacteraceae bacterium]
RDRAGRDFELARLESLPQPYRLPRKLGWLIPLVPGTAAYAGQVQHLLADPEMAALLAGSPQAGHILRPLCRMLGIQPEPGVLAQRREPPRRGVRPRRGASPRGVPASPADGVGLGAETAHVRPVNATFGSGPGSALRAGAARGSQFTSTGFHFARQNGGPELGSPHWLAPPPPLELPIVRSDDGAEAGADPPLNVPWRRAERG